MENVKVHIRFSGKSAVFRMVVGFSGDCAGATFADEMCTGGKLKIMRTEQEKQVFLIQM